MKNRMMNQGFTLVELLIVMAIIAILAVGILVGLNPVEQLNRAKDTNMANTIQSIGEGYERYFASNSAYTHVALVAAGAISYANQVTPLVTAGDLKNTVTAPTVTGIYFYGPTATSWYLCYLPTAKANQNPIVLDDLSLAASLVKNGYKYMKYNTGVSFTIPAAGAGNCAIGACYLCINGGQ